jgi:hypothetical protein
VSLDVGLFGVLGKRSRQVADGIQQVKTRPFD